MKPSCEARQAPAVVVRVDEPGNDDMALAADLLRVGIARLEIVVPADRGNAVALDGDRALLDQAAVGKLAASATT